MLFNMLMSGLELMVLGMGMVFLFLVVLIVCMQGMSLLAARLSPEAPATSHSTPRVVSGGDASDPRLIAVLSAAVSRYRSTRSA